MLNLHLLYQHLINVKINFNKYFDLFIYFVIVGNKENKVPSPFHFVKRNVKKVYTDNETNHLMGRLTTLDGKIWLKFLPTVRLNRKMI